MNAERLNRYLQTSRNVEGRERLMALARALDDTSLDEEIRLCRVLCIGMAAIAVLVLGAEYLF